MKKSKHAAKKHERLLDYFNSLNLESWWEQFSMSYTDSGQLKFATVHQFITSKTKDKRKYDFLWWILGPPCDEPRNPEHAPFKQFDWQAKRNNGYWTSSEKLNKIKADVSRCNSAFDEVKAIGAFNLDEMVRFKLMADQLDAEYAGRLNLPNLSAKENSIRLNEYINLKMKLQGLMHNAQQMFAKTRSVDFSALSEMLAIAGTAMLGTMSNTAQVDPEVQRQLDQMQSLNKMMLAKSNTYQMDLPDKDANEIIKNINNTITINRKKVN